MPHGRRLPWEYADGPRAGEEVPITSEPREEEAPGVPRESDESGRGHAGGHRKNGAGDHAGAGEHSGAADHSGATETREVRAEDPGLPRETNARLTEELRDVVGAAEVSVPGDRPHAAGGEHPDQHGAAASLNQHRFQLIRATAIALTFGLIVALTTGRWWILPLAAGVHALATMTVTLTIIRMTTISEHPSASLAAALAEQGVSNPDEHFSRMVEEFRPEPEHGASEVLSPGFNERSGEAGAAPADAAAEQSSAMTPTSGRSRPGGEGATPDAIILTTAAALFILSFVFPATLGGHWMWLLPAIMIPLLAMWVALEWLMVARGDRIHLQGHRPLLLIVVCTAIAVGVFCLIVALAFGNNRKASQTPAALPATQLMHIDRA